MLAAQPHPPAAMAATRRPSRGVTMPLGFIAAGSHCGIRKARKDLAIIRSERPAATACVYTTNLVQAAPILVTRRHMQRSGGIAEAIVVNAGNANACTGDEGVADAELMVRLTADALGIPRESVIVASTGVIGQRLPTAPLRAGIPALAELLDVAGGLDVADAIQTTDTRRKETGCVVHTSAGRYHIGGVAKGSGMIHPNMATTLGFVTTDADIDPLPLRAILQRATRRSFNRITVDGDSSTNDMVTVMANGASGVSVASERALADFEAALTEVLVDLGRQVAADGEGASRLVTVEVSGAATEDDAERVAKTIAGSNLVKTAIHGADANWGRIVAAAGRAGVDLAPWQMAIRIGDVPVLEPGYRVVLDEAAATAALKRDEVVIGVSLGDGEATATAWTCDLSCDYVRINASYRS